MPQHMITLICRKGAFNNPAYPACMAFTKLAMEWSETWCDINPGHRMTPCPLTEVCRNDPLKKPKGPAKQSESEEVAAE